MNDREKKLIEKLFKIIDRAVIEFANAQFKEKTDALEFYLNFNLNYFGLSTMKVSNNNLKAYKENAEEALQNLKEFFDNFINFQKEKLGAK